MLSNNVYLQFIKGRWFKVLVAFIIVLLVGFVFGERIGLMARYYKTVSSGNAQELLNSDPPPVERWGSSEKGVFFSIGYTEFVYPFGEIEKISSFGSYLCIESSLASIFLNPPHYHGKIKALPYEMPREKAVEVDIDPYSFEKEIMAAKPKSFFTVLSMPLEQFKFSCTVCRYGMYEYISYRIKTTGCRCS